MADLMENSPTVTVKRRIFEKVLFLKNKRRVEFCLTVEEIAVLNVKFIEHNVTIREAKRTSCNYKDLMPILADADHKWAENCELWSE